MSEVNVQIQNPQQTVNINNPSIVIEIPTDSIEVEITEQALEIQVQSPVIEVNIGGPCDCSGGGHTIEDEGTPLTQRDTLNFTGAGVTVTDAGGKTVVTIPGGAGASDWGDIGGTLSDQTDLQTALDGKVDKNASITGATKTKITYDSKGLVTAGDDAAIADITGLQDELDGKAETSHTHTFADIESGVLPDLSSSATVQPSGAFEVKYDGGIAAIQVLDDDESATIQAKGGGASISVGAIGAIIIGDPFVSIESDASTGDAGQVLTALGDGTATWQDAAGGGGSVEIIDITYSDMETALAGSTLTPGQFYRITDAAGTDLGFICQAIRENEITVNGQGGYLNADFQGVGDYGNTPETFNAQLGIWRTPFEAVTITYTNLSGGTFAVGDEITGGNTGATAVIVSDNGSSEMTAYMTSQGTAFDGSEQLDNGNDVTADMDGAAGSPQIVQGDVVIWNLLHYQLTDDAALNGDNPESNTDAYTLLDKATYPETYVTAWDVSEYNFSGDEIVYRQDELDNLVRGATGVSGFQWGRNECSGNNIQSPGTFDIKNLVAAFATNTTYAGANVSEISTGSDTTIENNILENGAVMTGITAGANCSISRNKIGQGATLGGNTTLGGGAKVNDNTIGNGLEVSNKTFAAGVEFSGNTIGVNMTETETITENIIGKRAIPGFSDIPGTLDITGLTALDFTAAWAQYRGIYNLTSDNATETISQIDNAPTQFPSIIRPAAGLVLTITGTAYSGIAAGQIALKATDYVLDGDKGEYIVLEIDQLGSGCLVEKLVVNGLI